MKTLEILIREKASQNLAHKTMDKAYMLKNITLSEIQQANSSDGELTEEEKWETPLGDIILHPILRQVVFEKNLETAVEEETLRFFNKVEGVMQDFCDEEEEEKPYPHKRK